MDYHLSTIYMISRLLYYLFLKPLSYLSMWFLHRISDLLFVVVYYLIAYRKKVVIENLTNSFPQKPPQEIGEISRKFYRHLCDIIMESVKLFSISDAEALRRCTPSGTELLHRLYAEGRSAIIIGGHYNNWELAALRFKPLIPHRVIGIYSPLKNVFFNTKIQQSRARFGMELVPVKNTKQSFLALETERFVAIFGADQSPSRTSKNHYWTTFLHQDTAVFYGAEKYARKYNLPVIFVKIYKIKRSMYRYELALIEENPADTPKGEITKKHVQLLEQQIIEQPEYWLWTHKRWKIKRFL